MFTRFFTRSYVDESILGLPFVPQNLYQGKVSRFFEKCPALSGFLQISDILIQNYYYKLKNLAAALYFSSYRH